MEKEKIQIRAAAMGDAKALLDIYAPYVETTAITFEHQAPSIEVFSDRMSGVLGKYPYLIAELDGEILGYAYAGQFKERAAYNWAVEVSVYVKRGKKRMGIGRRLYEALEKILAAQNILNLYACIAFPEREDDEYLSRDSVLFHERLGFQLIGEFHQCGYKFNRWYNMVWMEKHIGTHLEDQPAARAFDEVKKAFL